MSNNMYVQEKSFHRWVILHTDAQMVSSTITNMYFEILTYVLWFFI